MSRELRDTLYNVNKSVALYTGFQKAIQKFQSSKTVMFEMMKNEFCYQVLKPKIKVVHNKNDLIINVTVF